jgi:hypothetical protein
MTNTEMIRARLLARLGVAPLPEPVELRGTEWSHEFERLCRNRLLTGACRYGRLGAKDKPQWNRITDATHRLQLYVQTGNLEWLVDVANMMMLEFVEGEHPNKHFDAGDDGYHTPILTT